MEKAELMMLLDASLNTEVTITDLRRDLEFALHLIGKAAALLMAVEDAALDVDDHRSSDVSAAAAEALSRLERVEVSLQEISSTLPYSKPTIG